MKRHARVLTALAIAPIAAMLLLAALALSSYAGNDSPITAADTASSSSTAASSTVEVAPAEIGEEGAETLKRPTFTTPAVPPIDSPGNDSVQVSAPEMQEIPRATDEEKPVAMVPTYTVPKSNDLNDYMSDDPELDPGIGTLHDFVIEGDETSPIGFEVRESRRRLKSGEELNGLLILKVDKGSEAAKAGLRPYKAGAHHVLLALAIGAMIAFPPAVLAVPVIDYTEAGESYDMIIGVDGSRVSRFDDFQERMRDVQPGELVYFNMVRNGKRVQVAVPVPVLSTAASK
jgi:hypothetical protein